LTGAFTAVLATGAAFFAGALLVTGAFTMAVFLAGTFFAGGVLTAFFWVANECPPEWIHDESPCQANGLLTGVG
jgi:hypothetical protein